MTTKRTTEELMEGREIRRAKYEGRAVDKLDRQMAACDALIGELCRDGTTVFYINTAGGKVREFPYHFSAVDFLIRNRYV